MVTLFEPEAPLYLYGIVAGGQSASLEVFGVDGVRPVYTVAAGGLACLVSPHDGAEPATLSREGLLRRLLTHQRVVEGAMRDGAVLPVKFGTVLGSPREVRELLATCREELAGALVTIRGVVELEVAATWDLGGVLQEVGREEAVVRMREALAQGGQTTDEDRVRLGQLVKAHLDQRRELYRERMVRHLRAWALDAVPNALVSDEMVMNVAFLVERSRQHGFDAAVRELDELFQGQIAFRVVGPLPPYSFSTVEVVRLTPERIEEAQRTLGLGGALSEPEVRRAYRHRAAAIQRGGPGQALQAGELARLREVAQMLLLCCRSGPDGAQGAPVGEGGDGLFAIALRRAGADEIEPRRYGAAAEAGAP